MPVLSGLGFSAGKNTLPKTLVKRLILPQRSSSPMHAFTHSMMANNFGRSFTIKLPTKVVFQEDTSTEVLETVHIMGDTSCSPLSSGEDGNIYWPSSLLFCVLHDLTFCSCFYLSTILVFIICKSSSYIRDTNLSVKKIANVFSSMFLHFNFF